MATTSQKKPATTKTTKSASTTKTTAKKPEPKKTEPKKTTEQPFRREIWGGVLWVLALCFLVSYFGIQAVLLDYMALAVKGFLGYGYWLMTPILAWGGCMLIFHYGRPVRLRIGALFMMPWMIGALCHVFFCKVELSSSVAMVGELWTSGLSLTSGGVLAGLLAVGVSVLLSKVVAVILFLLILGATVLVALRLTPMQLWEDYRNRPVYEEEEEPAPRKRTKTPRKEPRQETSFPNKRKSFDIPLDGEDKDDDPMSVIQEKKPKEKVGFFRPKPSHVKTPDQVLQEQMKKDAPPVEVPPVVEAKPVIEPPKAAVPVAIAADPAPAAPVILSKDGTLPPVQKEPTPKQKAQSTQAELAEATAAIAAEIEQALSDEEATYQFPPLTLLQENQGGNMSQAGAELRNNARRLAETLSSFGVEAKPGDVVHGPSVTRYEFVLDRGVKLSKITNLSDDIALALGASGVRIAPIPDKISVVGIEVPNRYVAPVLIRDVLQSETFIQHSSTVAFSVGKDIGGQSIVGDISRLPHVLVAGTTGSGKSVCTNTLIVSLLYKSTPEDVRFIMVDPKMVELAPYNGIPHLLIPVVTDPKKAAGALQWAVFEMMKRYKLFSENNVKDLVGYNALAKTTETLEHLPSVVVVIDELADLMLVAAKEVEESICRVAQMGRAAGMHLVIATQRPSSDVITGLMKANIPSRIAFAVASSLESRIILDTQGAEKLVGKGDMLYAPLGAGKPTRVQGCFISPEEIQKVVDFVKQSGEVQYSDEVIKKIEESVQEKEKGSSKSAPSSDALSDGDELFPAAVEVILETGQASVSMLQRRLKLGYSRAARLVDQMEDRGIVGPFEGSKPRQLLITRAQWQEQQMGGAPAPESPAPDPLTPEKTEEETLPF